MQGKEYVFISNIDNLGATVDIQILNFLVGEEASRWLVLDLYVFNCDIFRHTVRQDTN